MSKVYARILYVSLACSSLTVYQILLYDFHFLIPFCLTHLQGSGLTPIQQNAVDLLNKQARCKEEQHLIVGEMKQLLRTLRQQHLTLMKSVLDMGKELSTEQRGLAHLISIKLMIIEGQHDRAAGLFVQYVPDVQNLSSTYQHYCTNVDFFPAHSEEAELNDSAYSDFRNELEDLEVSEDEDFNDDAPVF